MTLSGRVETPFICTRFSTPEMTSVAFLSPEAYMQYSLRRVSNTSDSVVVGTSGSC